MSPSRVPETLVDLGKAAKLRHDPDLIDRLLPTVCEGDPLADRVAAGFKAMPGGSGWKMLDEALLHGPDAVPNAPDELIELVTPVFEPPEWVDMDLLDAGALAYWRSGSINIGLALICGSLAYGYQNARLSRPLAATGRLTQMMNRRLHETSRWVAMATRPGALRSGAEGSAATIRLRIVHALVRAHLLESEGWDLDAWGVPISAGDTLVTGISGFLVIPSRAFADLGVRHSPAELEAMTHQWAWITSLMGAPPHLLPASYAAAEAITDTVLDLNEGPSEDSPKLMAALLERGARFEPEQQLPGWVRRPVRELRPSVLAVFARRWMDEEMADRLGVPAPRGRLLVTLMRTASTAREVARALGLLGSDERIVEREFALLQRVAIFGTGLGAIEPREVAAEPALSAG